MSSVFKLESVYLPKWPAMVVVGKRVTPEQAAEIIIRTNGWWDQWSMASYTKFNHEPPPAQFFLYEKAWQ